MDILKKKIMISVVVILVLIVISGITNYIDGGRVRTGIEPICSIKIVSEDGNKVTYWGLGYKVIRYPSVSPNEPFKNNKGVKYGGWFMDYNLDRYYEIKENVDKEKGIIITSFTTPRKKNDCHILSQRTGTVSKTEK